MKPARFLLGFAVFATALAPAASRAGILTADRRVEPKIQEDSRPVVSWVFYPADFLSCRSPAYAFRHLDAEFGSRVRLVAYGMNVDERRARSFLRDERLEVELITPTPERYRALYGRNPRTGVSLSRDGKIYQEFKAGTSYRYPSAGTLRSAVQQLIPATASRSPSKSPLPHPSPEAVVNTRIKFIVTATITALVGSSGGTAASQELNDPFGPQSLGSEAGCIGTWTASTGAGASALPGNTAAASRCTEIGDSVAFPYA